MRQLRLRLPIPPLLERSPELAALAILEAALSASEAALLASYAELYNGALDGFPRGASVLRANTVIIHARRLAATLAAYRDSLERDARREVRAATASASDELRHQHAAARGVHARVTSRTPR